MFPFPAILISGIAAITTTRVRIYMAGNQIGNASGIRIDHIEMRAFPGGPNLCVGGTVTASSGTTPAAAFGTTESGPSYLQTAGSYPQWIEYAFPGPITLGEVLIQTANPDLAPNPVEIMIWNGTAFVDAWPPSSQPFYGLAPPRLFSDRPVPELGPGMYNFESGLIPSGFIPGSWTVQAQVDRGMGTTKALVSRDIGDSTNTNMAIRVNATAKVYVRYLVQSEGNFDKFSIRKNGVEILNDSGLYTVFKTFSYDAAGLHYLDLSYGKDGSASTGTDDVRIGSILVSVNDGTPEPIYRVRSTSLPSGKLYSSWAEVQPIGAMGRTATASSDGFGLVAAGAVDGNNNSRWVSGGADGATATLSVTVPRGTVCSGIILRGPHDGGDHAAPTTYVVERSLNNGSSWTALYTQSTPTVWALGEERTHLF